MNNFKTYVEIPIFLLTFSVSIQGPVFTNLLIYRTCYVNLGYNQSECALLGSEMKDNYTQKLEELVEPHANIIAMVLSLPSGIICAILALFIGSWSDRFGRKPVMLMTITGQTIAYIIMIIFSLIPSLSSWFIAFTSIPVILSGGFAAALTTYLSYLTDITDDHNRGLRMGIFEVILSIAMLLGMLSSSYIFNLIGYVGIFSIAAGFHVISLFYLIFLLDESLTNRESENKFRAFFELEQIKIMARTTFKQRPNGKRTLIFLCLAVTSLFIFAIMSEGNCIYLFLRLKFGWSLKQYTLFTSVRDVISIIGTFIGVYGLHKLLQVDETILIIVGLISCMNGSLVQGLASTNAHIYFGGLVRLLAGVVSPMLRSLISKIANSDEVGKIFAVLVMCENILQMVGSPLYTYIYNTTLDTRPEFFNFITAGIHGFTIFLMLIVSFRYLTMLKEPEFAILNEDADRAISDNEI